MVYRHDSKIIVLFKHFKQLPSYVLPIQAKLIIGIVIIFILALILCFGNDCHQTKRTKLQNYTYCTRY